MLESWIELELILEDWKNHELLERDIRSLEYLDWSNFPERMILEEFHLNQQYRLATFKFLEYTFENFIIENTLENLAGLAIRLRSLVLLASDPHDRLADVHDQTASISESFWHLLTFCTLNGIRYDKQRGMIAIGSQYFLYIPMNKIPSKYVDGIASNLSISLQDIHLNTSYEEQINAEIQHYEVFVSYSHKDTSLVLGWIEKIEKRVEGTSIKLWLDKKEIILGSNWDETIDKALKSCKALLLFISPQSMKSENVSNEWGYFVELDKPIIPILIEQSEIPSRLHRKHYADAINLSESDCLEIVHRDLLRYYSQQQS